MKIFTSPRIVYKTKQKKIGKRCYFCRLKVNLWFLHHSTNANNAEMLQASSPGRLYQQ
jgi:hypothetical protein